MNSKVIESVTEKLVSIFTTTEEMLNSWQGEGNLQFPSLMLMISNKHVYKEEEVRQIDPLVRFYVRNHPDWHVTRGAHGGIMRSGERSKKVQAKVAKEALKQQMKATIESEISSDINEEDDIQD